jgi:hypothetical protein
MAYDLDIYQGETFTLSLTLKDSAGVPIDLTNYEVSGVLKSRFGDTAVLTNLNPIKAIPYTSGVIGLSISYTGTTVLPVGYAFYDIETFQTISGVVSKVLRGKASIYPEVT